MNVYSAPDLMTSGRTVQEGGRNVTYDLLGTNEEFRKVHKISLYRGQSTEQEITLPYPAFYKCPDRAEASLPPITIQIITPRTDQEQSEGDTYIEQIQGDQFDGAAAGWTVVEDDQDSMAMANYLLGTDDEKFDGLITRKIKVKWGDASLASVNAALIITYQAFYKDVVDSSVFRTENGPRYTGELGQHILDRLDALEVKTDVTLENMFGNTSAAEDILPEDLTAVATGNRVVAELHTIDTTNGRNLIAPAKGSFYEGSESDGTQFEMFLYHIEQGVITDDVIASGDKEGWLFIYTLNNLTAYTVPTESNFLSHAKYFVTNKYGDFVQLVGLPPTDDEGRPNTAPEATATTPAGYIIGSSIAAYRSANNVEVFLLKRVPFDPRRELDGLLNDTSAVITTKQSVVLNESNIAKYLNYSGTFVQLVPDTEDPNSLTRKLTLHVDYEFTNVNQDKTARTYARQAVYDHVRVLGNVVTDSSHRIGITYQAFGGDVTATDFRNMRKDVTNLGEILAKHHLLTYYGLPKHPVIQEITHRLRRMEDYHNHYHRVEHVIPMWLADVSSVGATASDVEDLKWYNIARLYDEQWMNGVGAGRDIGHFRVSSREQGWTYEFIVTVDLQNSGKHRMGVRTLGGTGAQYGGIDEFVKLSQKELVGVRLVWNGDGLTSGAILQIGIDYSKYNLGLASAVGSTPADKRDEDVLTVVNKSDDASGWTLFYNPVETTEDATKYIGVYGRAKYKPITVGTASSHIAYYTKVHDYTYFGTKSDIIKSSTDYFVYDEGQDSFRPAEEFVELIVGSRVDEYEYALYERSLYRTRWVRATKGDNAPIDSGEHLYVIDGSESTDGDDTTLPDGTKWGPTDANSQCVTRILERDDGGTVVWMGTVPLSYFSFGANDQIKEIPLHLSLAKVFQKYLDIDAITSLDFTFYDRREDRYFTKNVRTYINDLEPVSCVHGEDIFFFEDLCGLTVDIRRKLSEALDPGTYFLPGIQYFVCYDGVHHIPCTGDMVVVGDVVPAYARTEDTTFQADKHYYLNVSGTDTYTLLQEGDGEGQYTVGSAISPDVAIYEDAPKYFKENPLIMALLNVALGTSSYINQRFDLRQIRMHL